MDASVPLLRTVSVSKLPDPEDENRLMSVRAHFVLLQTCADGAVLRDRLTCPGGPEPAGGPASSARSLCLGASVVPTPTVTLVGRSTKPRLLGLCVWGACVPWHVCGCALYFIYFRQCFLLVLIKIHFQAFVGLA